ncbi:anion permease [Streptomyces sp. NPDC056519]|uniref:inorganic phosphate transporter n=1 Tax=Streptomyces sp. NPDC056519 TaxID=3345849 RepID=UPI0036C5A35E
MEHITLLVGLTIAVALLFDFTNGFHDTANAVSTTIATGALGPRTAVALSALCNLVGAFVSVSVAKTISGGIVEGSAGVQPRVILAALAGAVVWNVVTWLAGIPSSSSHALVGGLVGAAVTSAGLHAVNGAGIAEKIIIPAALSPLIAGIASYAATRVAYRVQRGSTSRGETGAEQRSGGHRAGQILSAALVSLAHGTSDGQKTMGVITLTLISAGALPAGSGPPVWVVLAAGLTMALGTSLGGWRIIRTLGRRLTHLGPLQGTTAQTGAAAVIFASSHFGFALSTTHVVTGSISGAGLGRAGGRISGATVRGMVVAWLLTLPGAGLVAAGAALLTAYGAAGEWITVFLLVGACAALYARSRKNAVTAGNVNDTAGTGLAAVPAPGVAV